MANMGLPVPLGFTITTEVCDEYYKNQKSFPAELKTQVEKALLHIENKIGLLKLTSTEYRDRKCF
jgi:pyruvate,orthophosphate dikinase